MRQISTIYLICTRVGYCDVRYAVLRGELMGIVANSTGANRPQMVTWEESGLNIENVKIEVGQALTEWPARDEIRLAEIDKAIDLIAQIRARPVQHPERLMRKPL